MKYKWEKEAKEMLYDLSALIDKNLPQNLKIIGIAIANTETGEGAFCETPNSLSRQDTMLAPDVWQEVTGDTNSIYEEKLIHSRRK